MTAAFTRSRTPSVVVTAALLTGAAALVVAASAPASAAAAAKKPPGQLPAGYKNLVVIYEENHSFDNLYGDWGRVGGQTVNGLQNATAATTTQVAQDGTAVPVPPAERRQPHLARLPWRRRAPTRPTAFPQATSRTSGSPSTTTSPPADKTCPAPGVFAPNGVLKDSPGALPGGCTRDIVHRFYQEQYQIDGGKQDRYVTGSDAVGLVMGRYETTNLPIYQYLHSKGAPNYVVADNFFQGAFGGSFLNHQYLVAARAPVVTPRPGRRGELGARPGRLPQQHLPALHTPPGWWTGR